MPQYLVIDNSPAAVLGSNPLNPALTRGFLEYAQHRGFIVDPARTGHPKDKPKVEMGVPYARERFFKDTDFNGLAHMREGRGSASGWVRGSIFNPPRHSSFRAIGV